MGRRGRERATLFDVGAAARLEGIYREVLDATG